MSAQMDTVQDSFMKMEATEKLLESVMDRKQELEYPGCNKCGMHKLKADGRLICPNCDTHSEPSGLVSRVKDPGVAGFVKKVIRGNDGKQYEVMVATDTDEEVELQTAPPMVELPYEVQPTITPDDVKQRPKLLLQALKLVFESHPARTMQEFKRLKKVRDQIEKLEFLIQNIKGE